MHFAVIETSIFQTSIVGVQSVQSPDNTSPQDEMCPTCTWSASHQPCISLLPPKQLVLEPSNHVQPCNSLLPPKHKVSDFGKPKYCRPSEVTLPWAWYALHTIVPYTFAKAETDTPTTINVMVSMPYGVGLTHGVGEVGGGGLTIPS